MYSSLRSLSQFATFEGMDKLGNILYGELTAQDNNTIVTYNG